MLVGTPPSIVSSPPSKMAAICVQIADAVKSLIQTATLSLDFVIERAWVETRHRDVMRETDPVFVIVVPRTLNVYAFDLKPRTALEWEIAVWIDRVVKTDVADCDPVALFMEEVVTLLAAQRDLEIPSGRARCIRIEPHPAYDSVQLLDVRVFRSVFLATYRHVQ